MSAITAALQQLGDVAAEDDLAANPLPSEPLSLEAAGEPIAMPTDLDRHHGGGASTRHPAHRSGPAYKRVTRSPGRTCSHQGAA
jgi:hypothetical protein